MSNTKTVMSQAANTLTTPLNVEDVFSTYLYQGNGSTQTITNGIDLDGEGGLVWTQVRSVSGGNRLVDSENGNNYLRTHSTSDLTSIGTPAFTLNSNGFTVPNAATAWNESGQDYASWTFRKAPKFFDVVTYTGNGVAGRTISHNLGTTVGSIIVKCTSTTVGWTVYHRGVDATAPEDYYLSLQSTNARGDSANLWNDTAPTDSAFTVGAASGVNQSGLTYVAYLFAHNDGDGGFNGGDIIKCGSYTGNGQNALAGGNPVELGFEPQWVMIIPATLAGYGSTIFDSMRGMANGNSIIDPFLQANTSGSEASYGAYIGATPTGFIVENSGGYNNENGQTYIYIAIRRGTKVPESGTEVFAVDVDGSTNNHYTSGFPVDLGIYKSKLNAYNWSWNDRLRGAFSLNSASTAAESGNSLAVFDNMTGWADSAVLTSEYPSWMWKRAPSFFDVVAYTGNGVAGRTVSHNLGVAPEMMWVKSRGNTGQWLVYNQDLNGGVTPEDYVGLLNSTSAEIGPNVVYWNSTSPSATEFTVGTNSNVNTSGNTYIAYLFATLAGVSKVGSYTGNGSSQTIDCGFTSGARFILIKRTDSTGDWYVWDTERGIVAGNDPHLSLNTTAAEVTSDDSIDPDNSGFIVNQVGATNINVSSAEYIFYAVA